VFPLNLPNALTVLRILLVPVVVVALLGETPNGDAIAAGVFNIKRARGIYRPALALPMPIPGAPILLLDVGANLSARPEHLVQFAFMGAAMSRAVLGVARPRVALLSNGEEASKGTDDVVAAHEQLAARAPTLGELEFVGNVEGTQVTTGAADVIVLLCVSAALVAAFAWQEYRSPNPLLDLRYLRVPQFTTANITAFCTYFATFAIFFFTALYLVEVAGASGYRLALVFLPMTVLMIISSVLAGRWTVLVGPRWSISIGCLLFATGLFLVNGYLNPHPDYGPVMTGLGLAGIGIGNCQCATGLQQIPGAKRHILGHAAGGDATNHRHVIGAVDRDRHRRQRHRPGRQQQIRLGEYVAEIAAA